MSERVDVVIVGGGFCGTMVAVHLLRSAAPPLTITLIDRAGSFGLGLAYGTTDPQHLLNVVAGRMSAFADEPDHLLKWLKAEGSDAEFGTFIPRMLYGRYLQHSLAAATAGAEGRHQLTRLCDEVINLVPDGEGVRVTLRGGETLHARSAVLALGNLPARAPRPFTDSQIAAMKFGPVSEKHHSVLIVGSGLTAVDAILSLEASNPECRIHVLSRRGLAPRGHRSPGATAPDLSAMPQPGASVRDAVRAVRKVVRNLSDTESQWRMVIDSMRQSTERFWRGFSASDQQRFLRHVRPFWDVHRHRIPQEIELRLSRLGERGQLHYLAGYVEGVEPHGTQSAVTVRHRRSGRIERLVVDHVVNCTGARFDFGVPLVKALLDNGDAVAVHSQLGLRTDSAGALLAADGQFSSKLFTLGPPCLGDRWESIAVPELSGQAQRLAEHLHSVLSPRG